MEYHCGNKDVAVASRIFERGMELFGDEPEYVLRYLNFLISINDENSECIHHGVSFPINGFYFIDARALFERVIGTFPCEKGRALWERWARYEYQYSDLAAVQRLERRMSEAYPKGKTRLLHALQCG